MHPCDERPVWAEEDRSGQSSSGRKSEPVTALIDDAMLIVGMVSSSVRRPPGRLTRQPSSLCLRAA